MTGRTEKRAACALCDVPRNVACQAWCPNHPAKVTQLLAEVTRLRQAAMRRGEKSPHRIELLAIARANLRATAAKEKQP